MAVRQGKQVRVAEWTFAGATNTGRIHAGGQGQDRLAWAENDSVLAIAVADGAGSTAYGHLGAESVVRAFVELATGLGKRPEKAPDAQIRELFKSVRERVAAAATQAKKPLQELSCTLVGAVLCKSGGLLMQVGDGAAVLSYEGEFQVPLWPVESEYLNSTTFVTSESAREKLLVSRLGKAPEACFLMSDGLQHLVLDPRSKSAHSPFFDAVLTRLSKSKGEDAVASEWIASMLASQPVTSRTDDDTCLVVARSTD